MSVHANPIPRPVSNHDIGVIRKDRFKNHYAVETPSGEATAFSVDNLLMIAHERGVKQFWPSSDMDSDMAGRVDLGIRAHAAKMRRLARDQGQAIAPPVATASVSAPVHAKSDIGLVRRDPVKHEYILGTDKGDVRVTTAQQVVLAARDAGIADLSISDKMHDGPAMQIRSARRISEYNDKLRGTLFEPLVQQYEALVRQGETPVTPIMRWDLFTNQAATRMRHMSQANVGDVTRVVGVMAASHFGDELGAKISRVYSQFGSTEHRTQAATSNATKLAQVVRDGLSMEYFSSLAKETARPRVHTSMGMLQPVMAQQDQPVHRKGLHF